MIDDDLTPNILSDIIRFRTGQGLFLNHEHTIELKDYKKEETRRQAIGEKAITLLRRSIAETVFSQLRFLELTPSAQLPPCAKFGAMWAQLDVRCLGTVSAQSRVMEQIRMELQQSCGPARTPAEAEAKLNRLIGFETELDAYANGGARLSGEETKRKVITILDDTQFLQVRMKIAEANCTSAGDCLQVFRDEMAATTTYFDGKSEQQRSEIGNYSTSPATSSLSSVSASPPSTASSSQQFSVAAMSGGTIQDDLLKELAAMRGEVQKLQQQIGNQESGRERSRD